MELAKHTTVDYKDLNSDELRSRFRKVSVGRETVLVLGGEALEVLGLRHSGFITEADRAKVKELLGRAWLDLVPQDKIAPGLVRAFKVAYKSPTPEAERILETFAGKFFEISERGAMDLNNLNSPGRDPRDSNPDPFLSVYVDPNGATAHCYALWHMRVYPNKRADDLVIVGIPKQHFNMYLASPLGFSEDGRQYIRSTLLPGVAKLRNITPLDPWEAILKMSEAQLVGAPKNLDGKAAIGYGMANFDMIERSDIVLANLNGTDPDSGTCIEVGYACKKGKMVVGYRTDFRLSGDSSQLHVNLQVETAIAKSGGKVFDTLAEALDFIRQKTSPLSILRT